MEQENKLQVIDPPKKWKPAIKKLKQAGMLIVVVLIALSALIAVTRITTLEAALSDALKAKETVKITSVRIRDRLIQIGELSTASYEYENTRTITNTRERFGWEIPGTTNSVTISYCGVLKVGYDVSSIQTEINHDRKLIFITLPEPEIKDNYVKLDGMQCAAKNNFFNPIDITGFATYFEGFEEEAELGAADRGIYEAAEERMQQLVINFLAVFPDYEVIFV